MQLPDATHLWHACTLLQPLLAYLHSAGAPWRALGMQQHHQAGCGLQTVDPNRQAISKSAPAHDHHTTQVHRWIFLATPKP